MQTKDPTNLTDDEKIECAAHDIIQFLIENPNFPKVKLTQIKNKTNKKYGLVGTLSNSEIMQYATEDELELIQPLLRRRSTRTISGVTIVAVMTKPIQCPGNCLYCPGEKSQPKDRAAQSYTGQEPAARRSILYGYDSYLQTKSRILDQLAIGHNVDKIDMILMGGTLLSAPEDYQISFVKGCYDAINNYPDYTNEKSDSLDQAIKTAEQAPLRIIGLTIETRPDYCFEEHVNKMLQYGATRVEIGVQTTRESILKNLKRGHTIQDTIHAIRCAKDAGLKINAHMMPNLPGSTIEEDYNDFKELFSNPDFRPDMLKIYPTLVVKGTELYDLWKDGKYKSYSLEETVDLIARIKCELPKYVRIQRVQRDIPAYLIVDGVKKSNLRQLVQNRLMQMNKECNCIRCHEIGFQQGKENSLKIEDYKLQRLNYKASSGDEIFLSYENNNKILGYLRLRNPSEQVFRPEFKERKTLIVREVRVLGEIVPREQKPTINQAQHRGFGHNLLTEAERISKEEYDAKKISVIAGVGVREYFYKWGYYLDGVYVSKKLS